MFPKFVSGLIEIVNPWIENGFLSGDFEPIGITNLGKSSKRLTSIHSLDAYTKNGLLNVNEIDGILPISASNVLGVGRIGLSIDENTMQILYNGKLSVKPIVITPDIEFQYQSPLVLNIDSDGEHGMVRLNHNNNDFFINAESQLSLKIHVDNITLGINAENSIFSKTTYSLPLKRVDTLSSSIVSLNYKTTDFYINDESQLSLPNEIMKSKGAIHCYSKLSELTGELADYFGDFLSDQLPDSRIILLKTSTDFQQVLGKLQIKSPGGGRIPFYSSIQGLDSNPSFTYNNGVIADAFKVTSINYNLSNENLSTVSYLFQAFQSGAESGIDVLDRVGSESKRMLKVRTDNVTMAVNAQNNLYSKTTYTLPLKRTDTSTTSVVSIDVDDKTIKIVAGKLEFGLSGSGILITPSTSNIKVDIDDTLKFVGNKLSMNIRTSDPILLVDGRDISLKFDSTMELTAQGSLSAKQVLVDSQTIGWTVDNKLKALFSAGTGITITDYNKINAVFVNTEYPLQLNNVGLLKLYFDNTMQTDGAGNLSVKEIPIDNYTIVRRNDATFTDGALKGNYAGRTGINVDGRWIDVSLTAGRNITITGATISCPNLDQVVDDVASNAADIAGTASDLVTAAATLGSAAAAALAVGTAAGVLAATANALAGTALAATVVNAAAIITTDAVLSVVGLQTAANTASIIALTAETLAADSILTGLTTANTASIAVLDAATIANSTAIGVNATGLAGAITNIGVLDASVAGLVSADVVTSGLIAGLTTNVGVIDGTLVTHTGALAALQGEITGAIVSIGALSASTTASVISLGASIAGTDLLVLGLIVSTGITSLDLSGLHTYVDGVESDLDDARYDLLQLNNFVYSGIFSRNTVNAMIISSEGKYRMMYIENGATYNYGVQYYQNTGNTATSFVIGDTNSTFFLPLYLDDTSLAASQNWVTSQLTPYVLSSSLTTTLSTYSTRAYAESLVPDLSPYLLTYTLSGHLTHLVTQSNFESTLTHLMYNTVDTMISSNDGKNRMQFVNNGSTYHYGIQYFQNTLNNATNFIISDDNSTFLLPLYLNDSSLAASRTWVSSQLTDFLTMTDLSPYVLNSSLTTTLSDYATKIYADSLVQDLSPYLLTSNLSGYLVPYVTSSNLTNTLTNYMHNTVDSMIVSSDGKNRLLFINNGSTYHYGTQYFQNSTNNATTFIIGNDNCSFLSPLYLNDSSLAASRTWTSSQLTDFLTMTDLSPYVTNTSLSNTLSTYSTRSYAESLVPNLSGYITTNQANLNYMPMKPSSITSNDNVLRTQYFDTYTTNSYGGIYQWRNSTNTASTLRANDNGVHTSVDLHVNGNITVTGSLINYATIAYVDSLVPNLAPYITTNQANLNYMPIKPSSITSSDNQLRTLYLDTTTTYNYGGNYYFQKSGNTGSILIAADTGIWTGVNLNVSGDLNVSGNLIATGTVVRMKDPHINGNIFIAPVISGSTSGITFLSANDWSGLSAGITFIGGHLRCDVYPNVSPWRTDEYNGVVKLISDTGIVTETLQVLNNTTRLGSTQFASDSIELNKYGTGDRWGALDFHSHNDSTDYSARIARLPGVNGDFLLKQTGAAPIILDNVTGPGFSILYENDNWNIGGSAIKLIGDTHLDFGGLAITGYTVFDLTGSNPGPINVSLMCKYSIVCNGQLYMASDISLKKNITVVSEKMAEDIVEQIEAVSFVWKDGNIPATGFIAQQVEQHFPTSVTKIAGKKHIDQFQMLSVLWKHVQTLTKICQEQESRIKILEAKCK